MKGKAKDKVLGNNDVKIKKVNFLYVDYSLDFLRRLENLKKIKMLMEEYTKKLYRLYLRFR